MEIAKPKSVPYSEDAEASILGIILFDPNQLRKCTKRDLVEEHFFVPSNRAIFKTMLDLTATGRPADLAIVTDKLKELKTLDTIGGAMYLQRLVDGVTAVSYLNHYLDIVLAKHKRRQIIQMAQEAEAAAFESEENEEALISKVKFNFSKLGFSRNRQKTIPEAVAKLVSSFRQAQKTGVSMGLHSRWFDLHQKTSGYFPGQKTIVAGKPGAGKTTLALNEALNSAVNGDPALIVSIEMNYDRVVARLIADLMQLNIKNFTDGNTTYEDIERFNEGGRILAKLPIYIVPGNTTIEKYDAVVREHVEEYGIVLAVLDYIQIVDPTPKIKFQSRNLELTHMSHVTVQVGNDTKISQIIVSQLSRSWAGTGRQKVSEPELHHLRDSGSLEQDADVVVFLFRDPDTEGEAWENNEPTICKVAKNRNGPEGRLELTFQKYYNRFVGKDQQTLSPDLLTAWQQKESTQEEEVPF